MQNIVTKHTLLFQYKMVQDARTVLFTYCASISEPDFIRSSEYVGNGGSIRNLLVHICNSYSRWMGYFALKQDIDKLPYESIKDLNGCKAYFARVDALMITFLDHFQNNYEIPITAIIAGAERTASPLAIFTHVITHEFHHKGQIATIGRTWGYIPIDTDVLR